MADESRPVMSQSGAGRDPPPVWDGEDPSRRWRAMRRDILLWDDDVELPARKRGVRLFRALTGKARLLAETIADEDLRQDDGVSRIIAHFDKLYAGPLQVASERDFEVAVFSGHRKADEDMTAFVSRKQIEFTRYEAQLGTQLPNALRGRLLLKQASLNEKQGTRVTTLLDGNRSEEAVRAALCRLDTDLDVMSYATGHTLTSDKKTLYASAPEDSSTSSRSPWPTEEQREMDPELTELLTFYEEENDVGFDSDDPDQVWIYDADLGLQEFDEETLEQQFASFADVQRAKNEKKKARGWTHPRQKGSGKGLTKGSPLARGKGHFYPQSWDGPLSRNQTKGKGKGKDHFDQARRDRDQRRTQQGMRSISRQQLESKIRCWRCGQLGHRARDCKGERLPAVTTGRRAYFVHDFDPESEEKSWAVLHNQSFTTIPSNLTLIDTGAVNALVGECQFLAIDRLLKTFGLGTVPTQPPQGLGGIGGGVTPTMAVMMPIALGGIPGIMSTVIIPGPVPLLLPLPLMKSLGAVIDLPEQQVTWQEDCVSQIQQLSSGHIACNLFEGIESFLDQVPRSSEFVRTSWHEQHIMQLTHDMHHKSRKSQHYIHQCHLGSNDSNATLGTKQVTFSLDSDGSLPTSDQQGARREEGNTDSRLVNGCGEETQSSRFMASTDASSFSPHRLCPLTSDHLGAASHLGTEERCRSNEDIPTTTAVPHEGTTLGQTQTNEQQVVDQGSRHIIMSPRHCPERQQDKSVVCMPSVCGTLAEEPRRVHQGLDDFAAIAAEHQDDLSEQCRVPPLTAFAVDQSLDRLSHLDVVRAQVVNDCHPSLPWSDGDPHHYYTRRVRCLQVDKASTMVQDQDLIPPKPWTGMILYQTLSQDSVPATSGSVTDADLDCIWSSLAAGQNLVQTLDGGAELFVHPPCKRRWVRRGPIHYNTPPYRLSMCVQDAAWQFPIDVWLLQGRRKQGQTQDDFTLATLYCHTLSQALALQAALTSTSCSHGADFLHTNLPGISSHRVPSILTVSIGESATADEAFESAIADDVTESASADADKVLGHTSESAIADETQNSQRRYFSTQGSHPQSNDHPETPDAELEKVLGNTSESAIADENKNSHRRYFSQHVATQSSQQEYGCNTATLNLTLSKTTSPCSLRVKVADQDVTMTASSWKILRPWLNDNDSTTMTDELLSQGIWDLFQHDPPRDLDDPSSLSDVSAWNFWDVIQELEMRLPSCSLPRSVKKGHEHVGHVSLGAHTSRGAHVLNKSWESPWSELLPLVHELARQRPAVCQHPYLSIAFVAGTSPPHVDANEGLNSVITLGSYQGGELIVNDKRHETRHRWLTFDATAKHEVLPYTGWRISIALYTPRDHHLLTSTHWNWLTQLGFPVRWWLSENRWRQQSPALLRANFPELEPIPEDELATAIAVDEDTPASAVDENNPTQTEELRDAPLPVAEEVTLETPTSAQKSALLRAHCNLGHPQVKDFVRALRLAGIRKGIRLWVHNTFIVQHALRGDLKVFVVPLLYLVPMNSIGWLDATLSSFILGRVHQRLGLTLSIGALGSNKLHD